MYPTAQCCGRMGCHSKRPIRKKLVTALCGAINKAGSILQNGFKSKFCVNSPGGVLSIWNLTLPLPHCEKGGRHIIAFSVWVIGFRIIGEPILLLRQAE